MANARPDQHASLIRLVLVFVTCMAALLVAMPAHAYGATHVVQPGDSLSEIAAYYGVTLNAVAAANGIGNSNYIYTGQQLVIPDGDGYSSAYASGTSGGSGYVTVGRGDSLSLIAALHGMTTNELMQLNGLSNPNHIWIGQQLVVYAGGESNRVNRAAPVVATDGSIHSVQRGETLSHVARRYGLSVQQLMIMNGLTNPNHVYIGQQLQVVGGSTPSVLGNHAPPAGSKRIEVNLANQTLTAWYGDTMILNTTISSGTDYTPTVTGRYAIGRKYASQRMVGADYDIPDVPWVMYFWDGYAFHGAYWHNNFGTPMSHGCVHLRPSEAEYLFNWAEAGTEVYVHW
jgi:LysM repeat protein